MHPQESQNDNFQQCQQCQHCQQCQQCQQYQYVNNCKILKSTPLAHRLRPIFGLVSSIPAGQQPDREKF